MLSTDRAKAPLRASPPIPGCTASEPESMAAVTSESGSAKGVLPGRWTA